MPGEAVFEYSLDDGSDGGAGFETVKPLAVGFEPMKTLTGDGFRLVGVRAIVNQSVAIGRAPAKEPVGAFS